MSAISDYVVDRSSWPKGAWSDESEDRIEWRDEATGLPCLMVRVRSHGAWCGYVGVAPPHPWHGKGYDEVRRSDGDWVDVHGGLTYAAACDGLVCHVPAPGEPENLWWFGFDCVHSGDVAPGYISPWRQLAQVFESSSAGETYRTRDYVRAEVASLAAQIAEAA